MSAREVGWEALHRLDDAISLLNAYPGVPGPQDLGHLPGRHLTRPPLYPGLGD